MLTNVEADQLLTFTIERVEHIQWALGETSRLDVLHHELDELTHAVLSLARILQQERFERQRKEHRP